jgi:ABC-type multidrug transport system ATPase subunit
MNITLTNIGKRYNFDWIFRKVTYEFTDENNYVILGANGSGKSTLLQVIAGNIIPSEGTIRYQHATKTIPEEHIYKHVSIASPYLELLEDFTLAEAIDFHAQFKPIINKLTTKQVITLLQLEKSADKQLKYFSSGMKQRVRLALAILSDTRLLLLDEPTSNLDKEAIKWYQGLVDQFKQDRLIIVCSNQQEQEYTFCNKQLRIEDFK